MPGRHFQHVAQAAQGGDAHAAASSRLRRRCTSTSTTSGCTSLVRKHALQDLLLAQRLAAALDQHAQHRVFARRQHQRFVRQRELLAGGVVGQRPAGKTWLVAAARAADQRHQARFQFRQFKGLGQEVVGTFVEAADTLDQRIARRQNQHRQALVRPRAGRPAPHARPSPGRPRSRIRAS
jgi:hypothetical protein